MLSAASYNRKALGTIWNLPALPRECPARQILLQGDLDHDLSLEPEEIGKIDWLAFSTLVGEFQTQAGIVPQDGKLGPVTLRKLGEVYGQNPAWSGILKKLGDLAFPPATVPLSPPPGPPLSGRNQEEQSLANLWNRYGAAIYGQAQVQQLPPETALAVFSVESNQAYDPRTGLLIIRFEPHIFCRQTGQSVPFSRGGQQDEWLNLARAYEVEAEAALLSTSYGLPQLMGFNWQVTSHPGVRAMVLAFQDSCVEQVAGFFAFVAQNGLVRYIRQGDWREFTRRYNGPGNVEGYSGRLIRAFLAVNSLKAAGARFKA
jgi:hypothetical protein